MTPRVNLSREELPVRYYRLVVDRRTRELEKFVSQVAVCLVVLLAGGNEPSRASDWPMWRFDAQRTASSPHELPSELSESWSWD